MKYDVMLCGTWGLNKQTNCARCENTKHFTSQHFAKVLLASRLGMDIAASSSGNQNHAV